MTENHEVKHSVLAVIQRSITNEGNESMLELPTNNEIEQMVKDLPKGKSLGTDGVIAEVLQKFWPIMKPACVALVHAYWNNWKLTSRVAVGIIKLIPKNLEVLLLLKWQPLMMLTLTEKLCAKILVGRMKEPTNKMVDP